MPMFEYCGRCRKQVPLLDKTEWAQLQPFLTDMIQNIQRYRESNGASLNEALKQRYERPPLEKFFQLTGYRETDVNALRHHQLDRYGPPCPNCGRLLMTKVARSCAQCGTAV